LALIGIWIVARDERAKADRRGLWLSVLSGLGFAGFKILTNFFPTGSIYFPLVAVRLAGICTILLMLAAFKTPQQPISINIWTWIACTAIMDSLGNAFFVLSSQTGRLDVAAVLAALYPAVTATLAATVLKEHLNRGQMLGIALMLVAIVLIAQH
jgi:drug/metabolite transporter (DMT)-like permease